MRHIVPWITSAALLAGAGLLSAQPYPTHPVRVIVPNAPGSGPDVIARMIAPPLAARLGQPVVVDNRAGAGTMIGGEIAAKSPPDGYTLLLGVATLAINPATYKRVPYNALRDFTPITRAVSVPGILLVHPSLPAKSAKQLIALAKARPGEITFASGGRGSYSHLSLELFANMAGISLLHVSYKGSGQAVTDLLAGHVSVMISNALSALPHIRSGRLRALGVTSASRAASAPEIPTIAEAGLPGYESVQWSGLLAPAGMPDEIVARLNKETVSVLNTPEMKERLARDGAESVGGSPGQFAAFLRTETEKWAKVAKAAGIQPE